MAADSLSVTVSAIPGGLCVTMTGELDRPVADVADHELRHAQRSATSVLLDLVGIEFMDAAGVAVVVAAHDRACRAGHRFLVRTGPGSVRRLFALTHADRSLEIINDRSRARHPAPTAPDRHESRRTSPSPSVGASPATDGSTRVAPVGELDLAGLRSARGCDRRDSGDLGTDHLILDLRRVTFLDSTGLRLALNLRTAAKTATASAWSSSLALSARPARVRAHQDPRGAALRYSRSAGGSGAAARKGVERGIARAEARRDDRAPGLEASPWAQRVRQGSPPRPAIERISRAGQA